MNLLPSKGLYFEILLLWSMTESIIQPDSFPRGSPSLSPFYSTSIPFVCWIQHMVSTILIDLCVFDKIVI